MDLDFLDEVSAFLDPDSLPTVTTPRNSTGNEDYQLILSRTNFESWGTVDSSSEDVEPESSKSSSSENEKKSSVPKQNNRQEVGDNRRKRYRERVKYERKELKKLERELTLQVRELIDSREGKKTSARTDLSLSKSFWRDLAFQQHELRTKSEADQKQLIAAIQSQASYIDNLRNVFCVQPRGYVGAKDLAKVSVQPMDNLKWLRMKSSNAALYEIYLKEINDSYERVDQVFEECGIDSMSIGSASSLRRINSAGGVDYIQYVNKLLLPFSFEVTNINMWKTCQLPHRCIDREVCEDIENSGNTIAFKFRLKHTLETGASVSILKRVLSKRFYDNDRVMIMWKVFSEGEGVFSGMDVDETAWVSIRPYSEGSTSGTMVEICSRQVPAPFTTVSTNDTIVQEFKTVMEHAVKEDERQNIRVLEKLLLEETVAGLEIDP